MQGSGRTGGYVLAAVAMLVVIIMVTMMMPAMTTFWHFFRTQQTISIYIHAIEHRHKTGVEFIIVNLPVIVAVETLKMSIIAAEQFILTDLPIAIAVQFEGFDYTMPAGVIMVVVMRSDRRHCKPGDQPA